jgi:hypothetical protein
MGEVITKCAGIDVSKLTLDIAVHGCSERFAAANDGVGHRQIAKRLAALARRRAEALDGWQQLTDENCRAALGAACAAL